MIARGLLIGLVCWVSAFAHAQVESITITSNLTITPEDTSYDGKTLVVDGATLTLNGAHTFVELQLINGAVLTHSPATSSSSPFLDVTAQSVSIAAGTEINVSGKGLLPTDDVSDSGAGSHGGAAVLLAGGSSNSVFGNLYAPQTFGIGGRNGSSANSSELNRRGGGVVKIKADQLIVDGKIIADGQSYQSSADGAGAGGSIWLDVGEIYSASSAKTWRISAKGGRAANGGAASAGGGRIAVQYESWEGIPQTGNLIAEGGLSGDAGAAPGTIYLQNHESKSLWYLNQTWHATQFEPLELTGNFSDLLVSVDGIHVLAKDASFNELSLNLSNSDSATSILQNVSVQKLTAALGGNPLLFEGGGHIANEYSLSQLTAQGLQSWQMPQVGVLNVSGFTYELQGDESWQAVNVMNSGVLTHATGLVDELGGEGVTLQADVISIAKGALVDVSGKGRLPAETMSNLEAGSHGGKAGALEGQSPLEPYGDMRKPSTYGTGGHAASVSNYSRGGGAIKLVANDLVLDGVIKADGQSSAASREAGAGGSVWIDAVHLRATSAHAGIRLSAEGGQVYNDPGAGGGRIAVYFSELHGFELGEWSSAQGSGHASYNAPPGAIGSLYFYDRTLSQSTVSFAAHKWDPSYWPEVEISGDYAEMNIEVRGLKANLKNLSVKNLVFAHDAIITTEGALTLHGSYSAEDVTIASMDQWITPAGRHLVVENYTYEMQGDEQWDSVTVNPGGVITHTRGTQSATASEGVELHAGNIFIAKGGSINVSGKGNLPLPSMVNRESGSHGGRAHELDGQTVPASYGDFKQPSLMGIGGHHSDSAHQVRGGGAIKIVADELTLDGQIVASGDQAKVQGAGAGAGGSIWIDVGTFRVVTSHLSRPIQANGGNAGNYGSAGGGRIAIEYEHLVNASLASLVSTESGYWASSNPGEPGTAYFHDKTTDDKQLVFAQYSKNPASLPALNISGDYAELDLMLYGINAEFSNLTLGGLYLSNSSLVATTGPVTLLGDVSGASQSSIIQSMKYWTFSQGRHLIVDKYTYVLEGEEVWDSVTVTNSGVITHQLGAAIDEATDGAAITANSIQMHYPSFIDVSAKGRLPGTQVTGNASGSHGGLGGAPAGDSTNPVYGNALEPRLSGVGGRYQGQSDSHANNTRGGGAIRLVADDFLMDGFVRALGENSKAGGGAGAGGSIQIVAGQLSTTRHSQNGTLIDASGGSKSGQPGGGGGRVAISYSSLVGFVEQSPKVRADGNSGSEAGSVHWEQLNSAPIALGHSLSAVVAGSPTNFTVRFNVPLDSASIDINDVQLLDVNQVAVPLQSITLVNPTSVQVVPANVLADGYYSVEVGPFIAALNGRGMDQNNNELEQEPGLDVYQFSFTVDAVAPALPQFDQMLSPEVNPSQQRNFTLSGMRSEPLALFYNSVEVVPLGAGKFSYSYSVSEGSNSRTFYARDAAGNASDTATVLVNVDSLAPVAVGSTPSGAVNVVPTTISLAITEAGSGVDWPNSSLSIERHGIEVTGYWSTHANGAVFTPAGQLLDGKYQINASLVDQYGNQSAANTFSFVLDRVVPAAPVLNAYPEVTAINQYVFAGSKPFDTAIWLGDQQVVAPSASSTWSYAVPLIEGLNHFDFYSVDLAGNKSAVVGADIRYDNTAPGMVPLSISADGSGTEAQLDWTAYNEVANGNDIAEYRVYLSSSPFANVMFMQPAYTLPGGTQQLHLQGLVRGAQLHVAVVAVDAQGLKLDNVLAQTFTPADVLAPEEISAFSVTPGATSLHLQWMPSVNSAEDLTAYVIEIQDALTGLREIVVAHDPQADSAAPIAFTIQDLAPASGNALRVYTRDQDGNASSGRANPGVTWLSNPVPTQMDELSAQLRIHWASAQPHNLVKHYLIYVSTSDFNSVLGVQPALQVNKSLSGGFLEQAIAGLTNDTAYYVAIVAVGLSGGYSPQVQTVMATPTEDNTPPAVELVQFKTNVDQTSLLTPSTLVRAGKLQVAATDVSGVSRIELQLDGSLLSSLYTKDADGFYSLAMNWDGVAEGEHTLSITAVDNWDNKVTHQYPFTLTMAAPVAPEWLAPAAPALTSADNVSLVAKAALNTQVQLLNNGVAQGAAKAVDASGTVKFNAGLAEGDNVFTLVATFTGRTAQSVPSAQVSVRRDSSLPAAPGQLSAQSGSAGQVFLNWSKVTSNSAQNQIVGYNVYRSTAEFNQVGVDGVVKINTQPLATNQYKDMPVEDAQYLYKVTTVNQAGAESPLSAGATAIADSTAPKALAIRYQSLGQVDPVSGRHAPAKINVEVDFSEPLRNKPYLAIAPVGGVPMVVELALANNSETRYLGSFNLLDGTPSGTAYAVLSAHDRVGNRGTEVEQGATLLVDAQGPDLVSLVLSPSQPLQVDPVEGLAVQLQLQLNDVTAGQAAPLLIPQINGVPLPGYSQGISLTLAEGSPVDAPVYLGNLQLPVSAGQDDQGAAAVETLSFSYNAEDTLGNVGKIKPGINQFQVYQGDLPPLAIPHGLSARAQSGGKVALAWQAVNAAAGYQVYRKTALEATGVLLESTTGPEYLDTPPADATYYYAVSSLRQDNGQSAESAQSDWVQVSADSVAPAQPANLDAQLNGQGIVLRWDTPLTDALGQPENQVQLQYALYRLNLAEGEQATAENLAGLQALQADIVGNLALDTSPSETEHAYVLVALDQAGNTSAPSNTVYLNVDLLPVQQLSVQLAEAGHPLLQWFHNGSSVEGFRLFTGPDESLTPLTSELVAATGGAVAFTDESLSGNATERRYSVVAEDANGAQSIASGITLPAMSVELVEQNEPQSLLRGVMNRLVFRVFNKGQTDATALTLWVDAPIEGEVYRHSSAAFAVAAGSFTDVPVIVGGYDALTGYAPLNLQLVQTPAAGQQVSLSQSTDIPVGNASLLAQLEVGNFTRGGVGQARFRLENTSAVEAELLMATASGKQASTELRFVLRDLAGNLLAKAPVHQFTGDVLTVNDGNTVARIQPSEQFVSDWFELAVPEAAPDVVILALEIDRYRYHSGRNDQVIIEGTGTSTEVSLTETPYVATVNSVSPSVVFGRSAEVVITGQATARESGELMSQVPVVLALYVNGFERLINVSTDVDGSFTYTYLPNGIAGNYQAVARHPDSLLQQSQAQFTVQGVKVSPTEVNVKLPRNYTHKVDVKVEAAAATPLTNLRLQAVDANGEVTTVLPEGISVSTPQALAVAAGKTGYVSLSFTGNNLAADTGTLRYQLLADTGVQAAQAIAAVTVNYQLVESKPALVLAKGFVQTGVGLGKQVQESVTLTNKGLDQWINPHISLTGPNGEAAPAWAYLASPAQPGTVAIGAALNIQLGFAPPAGTAQGSHELRLKVTGDNAADAEFPVFVQLVSSEVGSVFFHVADIYTATLDENNQPIPGLAGAKIELQHELVPDLTYALSSNAQGEALFTDLPAGRYSFRATAFEHDSQTGRLWIKPGLTEAQDVFLLNRLVSVEWEVQEVTLLDRYEIKLEATFQTNVPVAVVMFDPLNVNLPTMAKGQVFQGELSLTNYGLIRADNVSANLPTENEFVRFEFLAEVPDTLQAGEVFFLPYRIIAKKDFTPGLDADATGGGSCGFSAWAGVNYQSQCANGSTAGGSAQSGWYYSGTIGCGGGGGNGGSVSQQISWPQGIGGGVGWAPAAAGAIGEAGFCEAPPPYCPECNSARGKQ